MFGNGTEEERRATSAAGNAARQEKLTPGQRTAIARTAAYTRWYRQKATDTQRVETYLRQLAKITARAWEQGNDDRAIRAISAMGQWERLRMEMSKTAGKPGGMALEMEDDGATARLESARKRRNEALGLADGQEIVIESEAKEQEK